MRGFANWPKYQACNMLRMELQKNLQTFCEQIYPALPGIARRVAVFDVTALTTNQTRFSRNEQQRQTCSNRTIETLYHNNYDIFQAFLVSKAVSLICPAR